MLQAKYQPNQPGGSQRRSGLNGFWPGLGLPRPKAIVVIPKN